MVFDILFNSPLFDAYEFYRANTPFLVYLNCGISVSLGALVAFALPNSLGTST